MRLRSFGACATLNAACDGVLRNRNFKRILESKLCLSFFYFKIWFFKVPLLGLDFLFSKPGGIFLNERSKIYSSNIKPLMFNPGHSNTDPWLRLTHLWRSPSRWCTQTHSDEPWAGQRKRKSSPHFRGIYRMAFFEAEKFPKHFFIFRELFRSERKLSSAKK